MSTTGPDVAVPRSPRFARLAHLFLLETLAEATALSGAWGQNKLATAQDLGHRLKGAGGTFGYPHLSDLGACLQCFAEAGHRDAARRLVRVIASRVQELATKTAADGADRRGNRSPGERRGRR